MSNPWSECNRRHLPVKTKLTDSHPLPGPGDPDMRLAWHARPYSLSSAGFWKPRPGRAPPHTAADIYSSVPFPARASSRGLRLLFISLGSLLQIQMRSVRKFRSVSSVEVGIVLP